MKNTRFFSFVILFSCVTLLHVFINVNGVFELMTEKQPADINVYIEQHSLARHRNVVDQYYEARKTWKTSKIGSYLFKNIDRKKFEQHDNKEHFYNVMIWKHWDWLKHRHSNPLNECSVQNCRFSGDPDFEAADAVVVHLQKGLIPHVVTRDPNQIWIFLTDESPKHTFTLAKKRVKLTQVADVFNWSMTYRSDADVPVPYGRTVALSIPKFKDVTDENLISLVPYWKAKQYDVLVAILVSNCIKSRMKFIQELNEYINVDIHGACATNKVTRNSCPGHVKKDCLEMSKYVFYLVLENSRCRQYLTEKGFNHAYGKGAIPVILGPPIEDCDKLLPPNSFLHVDNYESLEHLAWDMIAISENKTRLLSYHAWRNDFKIVNEHGYFGNKSFHLCRLCEALNYNDRTPKVYKQDDIRLFLDPQLLCKETK
ncbi:alpha-(1,3)-fucosyltransferase 7-like [Choristoneura fumiferana]|uniref:alpha-(1,3)-fucosyltransferase 7-like n=1 Tax=Choristoneura fumiferana TaxID=7141 RepID=UPI003D15ECD3